MTIEEKLEALTQTVELLAGMQKTNEEQIAKLTGSVFQLLEHAEQTQDAISKLGHNSNVMFDALQNHESRISTLEG
jgi:chromosome segregation ATPase